MFPNKICNIYVIVFSSRKIFRTDIIPHFATIFLWKGDTPQTGGAFFKWTRAGVLGTWVQKMFPQLLAPPP